MKMTSSGFPSTSQTQGMWMSFGRRMPSPTPWVYYTHTKWNISGIARTQLRTAPVSGKLCRLSGLNLKCSIFNSYDCAHKRTKDLACRARATVLVTQLEPKEAGGPVPPPIFTLSRIHSPEVHNHEPSDGKHIADHIMQVMKNELMKNPSTKIGKFSVMPLVKLI